jgi:hypothetical protein
MNQTDHCVCLAVYFMILESPSAFCYSCPARAEIEAVPGLARGSRDIIEGRTRTLADIRNELKRRGQ